MVIILVVLIAIFTCFRNRRNLRDMRWKQSDSREELANGPNEDILEDATKKLDNQLKDHKNHQYSTIKINTII